MNLVVLSPHRGDAAYALGLAIESWLTAGHQVTILNCFTQSDYAPYSDVGSLHSHDRASFVTALRRREDVAWNKLLGNKLRFHDLDLLDAPLRLRCAVEEVGAMDIRPGDRAVARVSGAVAKHARSTAAGGPGFLIPLAVGGHIDHRVVRQAAIDSLGQHALPLAFYEDLPDAARPAAFDAIPCVAAEISTALRATFAAPPSSDPPSAVARKTRWAECYDSQIDSEGVQGLAEFLQRYAGRERLWADPIWQQSTLSVPDEVPA